MAERVKMFLSIALLLLFGFGCGQTYQGQVVSGFGAATGAVAGAVLNKGNPAVGAGVGAVIGGVIGGLLGDYTQRSYWEGYRACRNLRGFYCLGRCFSSPYAASAYYRTKGILIDNDIEEGRRAERYKGRSDALEDYRRGLY